MKSDLCSISLKRISQLESIDFRWNIIKMNEQKFLNDLHKGASVFWFEISRWNDRVPLRRWETDDYRRNLLKFYFSVMSIQPTTLKVEASIIKVYMFCALFLSTLVSYFRLILDHDEIRSQICFSGTRLVVETPKCFHFLKVLLIKPVKLERCAHFPWTTFKFVYYLSL